MPVPEVLMNCTEKLLPYTPAHGPRARHGTADSQKAQRCVIATGIGHDRCSHRRYRLLRLQAFSNPLRKDNFSVRPPPLGRNPQTAEREQVSVPTIDIRQPVPGFLSKNLKPLRSFSSANALQSAVCVLLNHSRKRR